VTGSTRARSWVEHLRSGGTTPWAAWSGSGTDDDVPGRVGAYDAPTRQGFLPGAQQLELLRRVNLAAGSGGSTDGVRRAGLAGLAERVLAASAPGRGAPDLELVGVREDSPFGPRPVDPAELTAGELMRVASSLLAEDLVAEAAAAPAPRPRALRRPWARPYRLVGDPWVADALRPQLVAAGRPPGGPDPLVLVLGADLPTMLAHGFTARSFDEGGPPWEEWLGRPVTDRALPPRADLPTMLGEWPVAGTSGVRLVLDPALVPGLVGRRRPLDPAPRLSAAAVDLARWVGVPLGLLVLPDERARLLRHTYLPRVRDHAGAPLGLPESHREWARERAARVRDQVTTAGYPVDGDPARLTGTGPDGTTPDDAEVLALAIALLLGQDTGHQGRSTR